MSAGIPISSLPLAADPRRIDSADPWLIAVLAPIESETLDAAVQAAVAALQAPLDEKLDRVADLGDFGAIMTRWHASLPNAQPPAGQPGWWSNGGQPTYFPG